MPPQIVHVIDLKDRILFNDAEQDENAERGIEI
jgi:hypothetical protein